MRNNFDFRGAETGRVRCMLLQPRMSPRPRAHPMQPPCLLIAASFLIIILCGGRIDSSETYLDDKYDEYFYKTNIYTPAFSLPLQIQTTHNATFIDMLNNNLSREFSNNYLIGSCVDEHCHCHYLALFKTDHFKGLLCIAEFIGNIYDIWLSFYDDASNKWSGLVFTGQSLFDIKSIIELARGFDIKSLEIFPYEINSCYTNSIHDVVYLKMDVKYHDDETIDSWNGFVQMAFVINDIIKDADKDEMNDFMEERLTTNKMIRDTDHDGIFDLNDDAPLAPYQGTCKNQEIYQTVIDDVLTPGSATLVYVNELNDYHCPFYSENRTIINWYHVLLAFYGFELGDHEILDLSQNINYAEEIVFTTLRQNGEFEFFVNITHSNIFGLAEISYIINKGESDEWEVKEKQVKVVWSRNFSPVYNNSVKQVQPDK